MMFIAYILILKYIGMFCIFYFEQFCVRKHEVLNFEVSINIPKGKILLFRQQCPAWLFQYFVEPAYPTVKCSTQPERKRLVLGFPFCTGETETFACRRKWLNYTCRVPIIWNVYQKEKPLKGVSLLVKCRIVDRVNKKRLESSSPSN
jgi:hypothetical protein